jgi:hypothetical protein
MYCTILLLAHIISYTLDRAEPEREEPMEQVEVEDLTNLPLDQGKVYLINDHCFLF